MTPEELELVVESLLAEGVPTGVISRVFSLDVEMVKQCQRVVRIRRYGTDDLAEYIEQMEWDAIDKARDVIEHGSQADQNKILSTVLGKRVALTGRRTPEGQRRNQEAMIDALSAMREGKPKKAAEPSPFIARMNP